MNQSGERLLAKLPKNVAKAMRAALALLAKAAPEESAIAMNAYPGLKITRSPSKKRDPDVLFDKAFSLAGYPESDHAIPLASELGDVHHALARLVARPGIALHRWAIPQTAWARRRWLGIDRPGAADRDVTYKVGGKTRRAPLWRALHDLKKHEIAAQRLMAKLPAMDRVEAFVDLTLDAYCVDPPEWSDYKKVRVKDKRRVGALADRVTDLFSEGAPRSEAGDYSKLPDPLDWLIFLALVRAKVSIKPRWDWMLPASFGSMLAETKECARAIPEPRRGRALARKLADDFTSAALATGLQLAKLFPSEALVTHLIERADEAAGHLRCPPRREYLEDLADVLPRKLAKLVRSKLASLPQMPLLRTKRSLYVRSADELTEGQRTQFAILGEGWETDDGPMVRRKAGKLVFGPIDFVSAYVIEDGDGNPAYEALLYMDEDGAVCQAGSTRSVAYVSQENFSCNVGEPVMEALHALLHVRPPKPKVRS